MKSRNSIFESTKPVKKPCIHPTERWFTWSPGFRKAIAEAGRRIGDAVPRLNTIHGFKDYNYTYDLHGAKKGVREAMDLFAPYALDLYDMEIGGGILLFDRMIDEDVSGSDLSMALTLLRKSISRARGGKMEALYAPLTPSTRGDFPLHCDLYIPKRLFNIYEDVARDGSGASIFLPMDAFKNDVLPQAWKMPIRTRRKLVSMLENEVYADQYTVFFDLINDSSNPWFRQLKLLVTKRTLFHKFEKGQGYMLHDRRWLHGRTKPNGKFSLKRVHRLVFNSERS